MNPTGLVGSLLEGMGLPVRRIAQACLFVLVLLYWISPGTLRTGINEWATSQAERAQQMSTALVQDILSRLTLSDALATGPKPAPQESGATR